MAGTGGARSGAGRKPKRDKYATAIAKAEGRIRDRLPLILDSLFELADGVTVQERDASGGVKVYTRPPDRQAATYLVDRILGKPTERHENTNQTNHSFDERFLAALAQSYGRPSDYPSSNGIRPHLPHGVPGDPVPG